MDIDEPQQPLEQKALEFKSRLVAKTIDAKELTNRLKVLKLSFLVPGKNEIKTDLRIILNALQTYQELHEELRSISQDAIVKQSLDATAKELVNPKILKHSSPAVKAYAATCLADMLRLYAPEAPFSTKETIVSKQAKNLVETKK